MKKITNLQDFSVKDFFFFDKSLTPVIITFLYWLTLLLILISGLTIIFTSFSMFRFSFNLGLLTFFSGVITIVVGILTTRVVFELICVLFNINRNIEKLASNATNTSETINNNTDNQ